MGRSLKFAFGLFVASGVAALAPAQTPPPGPTTHTVVIKGHQYLVNGMAVPLQIKGGDKVVWVNKDPMPHTATSDFGARFKFDTKVIKPGMKSAPVTFPAGDYLDNYHCEIHPAMKGRVVVGKGSGGSHPLPRPRVSAGSKSPR